jgi:protein TonB
VNTRSLVAGFSGAAMLAACSVPPPDRAPEQAHAGAPRTAPLSSSVPAPLVPPLTLDGYKKAFAQQVARGSPEVFTEPLPEMLKSVVVLEVTIGSDGRLLRVAVRRSNGYKALENLAMESVRRAAPFAPPAWTVRRSDGTVNFLETFLFRDDGRYQIRSLVASR